MNNIGSFGIQDMELSSGRIEAFTQRYVKLSDEAQKYVQNILDNTSRASLETNLAEMQKICKNVSAEKAMLAKQINVIDKTHKTALYLLLSKVPDVKHWETEIADKNKAVELAKKLSQVQQPGVDVAPKPPVAPEPQKSQTLAEAEKKAADAKVVADDAVSAYENAKKQEQAVLEKEIKEMKGKFDVAQKTLADKKQAEKTAQEKLDAAIASQSATTDAPEGAATPDIGQLQKVLKEAQAEVEAVQTLFVEAKKAFHQCEAALKKASNDVQTTKKEAIAKTQAYVELANVVVDQAAKELKSALEKAQKEKAAVDKVAVDVKNKLTAFDAASKNELNAIASGNEQKQKEAKTLVDTLKLEYADALLAQHKAQALLTTAENTLKEAQVKAEGADKAVKAAASSLAALENEGNEGVGLVGGLVKGVEAFAGAIKKVPLLGPTFDFGSYLAHATWGIGHGLEWLESFAHPVAGEIPPAPELKKEEKKDQA